MRNFYLKFIAIFSFVLALCVVAVGQNKGFDVRNMDRSAEACTDFFQYANGNWVKNAKIPPSQSRWGSFNILRENNRKILKEVLEKAAKENAAKGSDSQLTGDFYSSCMNETAINGAGAKPVMPYLNEIRSITNKQATS